MANEPPTTLGIGSVCGMLTMSIKFFLFFLHFRCPQRRSCSVSSLPAGISWMVEWAPSLDWPSDEAMTSTASDAVASTASGEAPSTGFTSTRSMTDSRPAHRDISQVRNRYQDVWGGKKNPTVAVALWAIPVL